MRAFRTAHEARDAARREDQRDDSGERVIAGRRSLGRNAVTEGELQVAVSQDLETLMNTTNLDSTIDLSDYPEVGRSVLNFGFPDIVHRTVEETSLREVGGEIEAAIRVYEPRLVAGSVSVSQEDRADTLDLKVRFRVRASLHYDTYNVPVEFVADIERGSGKIVIGRN